MLLCRGRRPYKSTILHGVSRVIGSCTCMECLFPKDELVGKGENVLFSSGSGGQFSVEYPAK